MINAKISEKMITWIILARIMHKNIFIMMKMNASMTCYQRALSCAMRIIESGLFDYQTNDSLYLS